VYQANGCLYCHSQQVRSEKFGNWWEDGEMKTGADIKRGWGVRRTVSRDYIYDRPTMLGTMRTGPDLANVGSRYAAPWQHNHMFNPRAVNSWSIMPSFAFLYTREKVVGGQKSAKALRLGREWTVDPGYRWRPTDRQWAEILAARGPAIQQAQRAAAPPRFSPDTPEGRAELLDFWLTTEEEDYQVLPTDDAEALVAYLLELRKAETPLPEAKE
jgi:cytochrome c oxidase cbb3-type subunit 2